MKKNSYISLVLIVCLLCLTIGISFAWFQVSISNDGNTINTGKIIYTSKGYDKEGEVKTSLLSSKEVDELVLLGTAPANANTPLFEENNVTQGDSSSVYVSIRQESLSIDLDYSMNFSIGGDIDNASIFYYQITNVTSGVLASAGADLDAKIKSYATANPTFVKYNIKSLPNISKSATTGSLDQSDNSVVYRIDYGMYEDSGFSVYAGTGITVSADFLYAQKGSLSEDASSNETYYVGSEQEMEEKLALVKNGDTIVLSNDVFYTKDLIITNPINLIVSSNKLTVEGNLRIIYTSDKTTLISFNGAGCIRAKAINGAGGNFSFEAPNGKLRLVSDGSSTDGDVLVSNTFKVNATYNDSGFSVEGAKIYSIASDGKDSHFKHPVYLDSNTSMYLASGSSLGNIIAVSGSTNIKVSNNGSIDSINFMSMFKTAQTDSPQIEIAHYSSSSLNISLPTWSTKFVVGSPNSGNTRIKRKVNSGAINIVTSGQTYELGDIEYDQVTEFVVDNGTDKTDLTVYYQDKYEGGVIVVQTLAEILDNYFSANSGYSLANVKRLVIVSSSKPLTANDFFINKNETISNLNNLCDSNNKKLAEIDLSLATVEDDTIPANAFFQCTALKKLILPTSGLTALGANAINQTSINEITIPASVTKIGQYSLKSIKFIHMLSIEPANWSTLTDSIGYSTSGQIYPIILVNKDYIEAYRTAFRASGAARKNYIFADGVVDDSGLYVLGPGGEYGGHFINCYASSNIDNYIIGTTTSSHKEITINGSPVTITGIGPYAYLFLSAPANTKLSFAGSIKYIGRYAFGATTSDSSNNKDNLVEIDLNAVTYIDGYSFYRLYNLEKVTMENLEYVGEYAFRYSSIVSAQMPNVKIIETYAFDLVSKLTAVYLRDIEYIGAYAFSIRDLANTRHIEEFIIDASPENITFKSRWNGVRAASTNNTRIYVPYEYYTDWIQSSVQYTQMNASTNAAYVYYIHIMGDKYGQYLVNGYDIGQYVAYESPDNIIISSVNLEINGTHTVPTSNSAFMTKFGSSSKEVVLNSGAFDMTQIENGMLILDVDEISTNTIPLNKYVDRKFSLTSIKLTNRVQKTPVNTAIFPALLYDTLFLEAGIKLSGYNFQATQANTIYLLDGEFDIPQYCFQNGAFTNLISSGAIITQMGQYAFQDVDGVQVVVFDSVANMATRAFANCAGLEVFSAKVSGEINTYAFYQCTNLVSIDFGPLDPSISISINNYAISGCTSLMNVRFENVSALGQYAFSSCPQLVSLELPRVTSIGSRCFSGCTALKDLFLPNLSEGFFNEDGSGATYVFLNCTSLEYIYLGFNGVVSNITKYNLSIPSKALTSPRLEIVSNASSLIIKRGDFVDSVIPTNFKFSLTNLDAYLLYRESTSTQYNTFLPYTYECPVGNTYTSTNANLVSASDGVNNFSIQFKIGVKISPSLMNDSGVEYGYFIHNDEAVLVSATGTLANGSLNIPSQMGNKDLTRIGFRALSRLNLSAEQINLPSSVEVIGASAFEGLSGITTCQIEGVESIEPYAFYQSTLTSIESDSVITIYGSAFENTKSLISAKFLNLKYLYSSLKDANGENVSTDNKVFKGSSMSTLTLSKAIEDVGTNATINCNKLTSIILMDFTYQDGDDFLGTFHMATGGKYYERFNGNINYYPAIFKTKTLTYYNTLITSGSLNYVMTLVDLGGEVGWKAIGIFPIGAPPTNLTLPASKLMDPANSSSDYYLLEIGDEAFVNLSSLVSLTIPRYLRKLSGKAFVPLSNLTSIAVDANNEFFESTDDCLYAEDNYSLIAYPQNRSGASYQPVGTANSGARSIGDYAFYGARNLTSVSLSEGVNAIGAYAFYGSNPSLTVNLLGAHAPYLGLDSFYISATQMINRLNIAHLGEYENNYQYAEYYDIWS